MIAEFMHFYPAYDLSKLLNLYSVSFYALYANMYRILGSNRITDVHTMASAFAGGDALNSYLNDAQKQAKGMKAYIEQINILKKVRGLKK